MSKALSHVEASYPIELSSGLEEARRQVDLQAARIEARGDELADRLAVRWYLTIACGGVDAFAGHVEVRSADDEAKLVVVSGWHGGRGSQLVELVVEIEQAGRVSLIAEHDPRPVAGWLQVDLIDGDHGGRNHLMALIVGVDGRFGGLGAL